MIPAPRSANPRWLAALGLVLSAGAPAGVPATATATAATAPATATAALSPLALSCLGCHQPAAVSSAIPALGRLPSARIVASLRHARDAPEPGSIMARFASKLTDADIAALAAQLGARGRP